jgi:hypothetical protein
MEGKKTRHAHRTIASIIPFRRLTAADLDEALAAVEFLSDALERGAGTGIQTGLHISAMAVAHRMRRKHNRPPAAAPDAVTEAA